MNNIVLENIMNYANKQLRDAYGYCGVAESDTMVMINSDDREGNDIKITIQLKPEDEL